MIWYGDTGPLVLFGLKERNRTGLQKFTDMVFESHQTEEKVEQKQGKTFSELLNEAVEKAKKRGDDGAAELYRQAAFEESCNEEPRS